MARLKENNIVIESSVARLVTKMCNATDKTQLQIAEETGISGTNIITMFKTGRTKFPLNRIKAFCAACDTSPEELLETCLAEYNPEVLDVLMEIKGRVLSAEEKEIIATLRAAKREADQHSGERSYWNIGDKDKIKKWAESTVKKLTA